MEHSRHARHRSNEHVNLPEQADLTHEAQSVSPTTTRRVRSFVEHRGIRPGADTDDIVQETMLRALTAESRFDGSSSRDTWLCSIAARVVWEHRRRIARTRSEQLDPDEETGIAYGLACGCDPLIGDDEVIAALRRLPHLDQLILVERYVDCRSISDIAASRELSIPTVKSRMQRARGRMREEITRASDCPTATSRRRGWP